MISQFSFTWPVSGSIFHGQLSIPLDMGWSLISLPYDLTFTAEQLGNDINAQGGACTEIDRWYAGGWDSHVIGLPFNDFDVSPGTGYFVKCSNQITYLENLP